jgi:hypothetical protein
MNRSAIARRYAPLLILALVQLAIISVLPSTAPSRTTGAGAGAGAPVAATTDATAGVTTAGGAPAAGSPPAAGSASPAGGGNVGGNAAGGSRAPVGQKADTAHCVEGRQFNPAIDFYAPPCAPAWHGDNGGATYQGVTADSIKIIEYIPQSNAAVQSIAEQAGFYVSPEKLQAFRAAMQTFINAHYELYGREIHLETADGTCSITPPDIACLRNDFRRIIKDRQPYAIVWAVPGCSACFDEMSQLRTVNVGGVYFTDEFSRARAPYHWDAQPSGTHLNDAVGEFWCANLAHRPAAYALDQPGTMNGKPRKLGVIGPNDPQMQATVQAAKAALATCGDKLAAEYYYAADLTTAAQSVQAGIAKMRDAGVTSIYYLADIAGPGYFLGGQQSNDYFAENIMSGAGTQDNDFSGQTMQSNPIACPKGPPCPFNTGFGLSTLVYEPLGKDAGARVWAAAGNKGPPPYDLATFNWNYYSLIATLIQAAGPALTPEKMAAGIRAYGLRGDANHNLRGFPTGSYTWGQDMGMQYWNKDLTSPYNGAKGAYVRVGGRSQPGGWVPGAFGTLPQR